MAMANGYRYDYIYIIIYIDIDITMDINHIYISPPVLKCVLVKVHKLLC